ncbi:hypothetical protein [Streptomyces sp. NPDC052693]|uniref:hypothetical protein n=1 Tax=Streptomyces sp. NPDC052693 TaxID=3155814 RepID=UPI003414E181
MGTPTERTDDLAIRQPRQERTRQAWARILDAGVALIEEGGYEAFTIADFATMPVDHDTFTSHLALSAARTLLAPQPGPAS